MMDFSIDVFGVMFVVVDVVVVVVVVFGGGGGGMGYRNGSKVADPCGEAANV